MKNPLLLFFLILNCLTALLLRCSCDNGAKAGGRDVRQDMRTFIQRISSYAKAIKPGFIIMSRNGPELLTENGDPSGTLSKAYAGALNGVECEGLYYGYLAVDVATSTIERNYLMPFTDLAWTNGIPVFITDFCTTAVKITDAHLNCAGKGYISFESASQALDNIPPSPPQPYNVTDSIITTLSQAKNFLALLNPGAAFTDKNAVIVSVMATDYDVCIVDYSPKATVLTAGDVALLKQKANGGKRLVLCDISIGTAGDARWYWNAAWSSQPPSWLDQQIADRPGVYEVRYWDAAWQSIIDGNDSSFVKKVLDAGFDGACLDDLDAFQYWGN